MPVSSDFSRVLVAITAALGISAGLLANGGTACRSGNRGWADPDQQHGSGCSDDPGGWQPDGGGGWGRRCVGNGAPSPRDLDHQPAATEPPAHPQCLGIEPLSLAATGTGAFVLDGVGCGSSIPPWPRRVTTVSVAGVPGEPTLVAAGHGGVWGINSDTAFRLRRAGGSMTTPKRFRFMYPRARTMSRCATS